MPGVLTRRGHLDTAMHGSSGEKRLLLEILWPQITAAQTDGSTKKGCVYVCVCVCTHACSCAHMCLGAAVFQRYTPRSSTCLTPAETRHRPEGDHQMMLSGLAVDRIVGARGFSGPDLQNPEVDSGFPWERALLLGGASWGLK